MQITRADVEHPTSFDGGYEQGFEGKEPSGGGYCSVCFGVGYRKGQHDREEVQRSGSSNT